MSQNNDLNSTDLSPENESRPSHKRGILILIIIIAIAAAVGSYIYFAVYSSPASTFQRAFKEQDYDTCAQLSRENADDPDFAEEISTCVLAESEEIEENYRNGDISAKDALTQLQELNTVSDGLFQESLDSKISEVKTIENVYISFDNAKKKILSGNYLEGIQDLMEVSDSSEEIDVDLEDEISELIKENQDSIKTSLFEEFSRLVKEKNFSQIKTYIDFILGYIKDADFSDFQALIAKLQSGTGKIDEISQAASDMADSASAAIKDKLQDIKSQFEDRE